MLKDPLPDLDAPMGVQVQVFAFTADTAGVWKVGGIEPWRSGLVTVGNGPHNTVLQLLRDQGHDVEDRAVMLHGTSWQPLLNTVMLTYGVVVKCDGLALDHPEWDVHAMNPPALLEAFGGPAPHEPDEEPDPTDLDVAEHVMRHFAFLWMTNPRQRKAFDQHWNKHLPRYQPALARLYKTPPKIEQRRSA